jgi:hypothetical protein
MADDAQNQKEPVRRVVVQISPEMQFALSQVAGRMLLTKKLLHAQIWRAGVEALLGVSPEEVEEAQLTSLPRATAANDPKKLMALMLKGK